MSGRVAVVGAGPNGLVAAAKLARSGREVVVLEARDAVGGLAALDEIASGYRAPGPLHDSDCFSPEVARELGLGVRFAETAAPLVVPRPDGSLLRLSGRPEDLGERDAAAWRDHRAFLDRIRPFLRGVLHRPPPTLEPGGLGDLVDLAFRGLALRRLGREDMGELTRVAPMCAADWLNERFADPVLVEALAAPAVVGGFNGPWAAGTAAILLLHEALRGAPVEGGTPALLAALEEAARGAGATIRCGARVRRIEVEGGRVVGVRLDSGERLDAAAVLATCDPKQAILGLVDPAVLDVATEHQLQVFRARGTTAQVRLALSGPLELAGAAAGESFERIRLGGGHVDELERAFDAAKYRTRAPRPHLEIRVPSVGARGLAPDGGHVVSVLASTAAHDLAGGWTATEREGLLESVLERLAGAAPGLRDRVVAAEVLAPPDLERRYGTTGGHLHHGEHALDQLLSLRPGPCASRYATPVDGLFLGGSGSHPGGGLTGIPGLLAAGALLRD